MPAEFKISNSYFVNECLPAFLNEVSIDSIESINEEIAIAAMINPTNDSVMCS